MREVIERTQGGNLMREVKKEKEESLGGKSGKEV